MKPLLDFDDAGAGDDHPARGVTVGDIRAWHDHYVEGRSHHNFSCKANGKSDPPQDCDWPFCGCDKVADKVVEAVTESGFILCGSHRQFVEALKAITHAEEAAMANAGAAKAVDEAMTWSAHARQCRKAKEMLAEALGAREPEPEPNINDAYARGERIET